LPEAEFGQRRRGGFAFRRRFPRRIGRPAQDRPLQLGRVPLHPRVLDRGQGAGQLDVVVVLRPGLVVEGLDFDQGVAELSQRLGHLLGVTAGVKLRFLEEPDSAREVLERLVAAHVEFGAPAAGFLEAGAFPFQLFLLALEVLETLLRFVDLDLDLLARGRTGPGGGRRSA